MVDCDMCGDREAKHRSTGRIKLCHPCAHEMGLGHSHPDDPALYPIHAFTLEGVELKDHVALYVDEVRSDG